VEKTTESQGGTATFLGFARPSLPPAPIAVPEAPARQIEFIGDSYTVGYGNTSPKHECTEQEIWATTDTSQAFGPLTAKHYDADYQINAISGRGIVRNYNGFAAPTLPEQYPYVLFDQKTLYTDPDWHPQIIVIGLGTNDFTTPLHDGEKWKTRDELHADYEATYVKFVQDLRAKNPGAFFILMATDQVNGEIQSEVQKVMARLNARGESRIAFLPMNGLGFGGCNYHPTTADDQKVTDSLTGFIDAQPELWQGK
jgi:lysophospholipase L1-like esterase